VAIPLGWMQLKHQKVRFAVALSGIAFAVILILMQLGFQSALFDSAVRYQERLDYDIALFSTESAFIASTRPFSIRRLYQARAVEGVAWVSPVYVSGASWKNPWSHEVRNVFTVGLRASQPVLDAPGVTSNLPLVRTRDAVLFDSRSRPEYGPVAETFGQDGDVSVEINGRTVEIAGIFDMGTSFGIDASVITSDDNFLRIFPDRRRNMIDIGLVKLEPGADPEAVREAIAALVPDDVLVMTRADWVAREVEYWNSTTPIGYVFAFGVLMGFVVGAIIVYQILFADVSDHLAEYATLKAMGYSNRMVSGVVIQQAVILSVLGFAPGVLISLWLYENAREATQLPVIMTPERAVLALALTVLMCTVSALIAVRKVRALDPAEIF
jgi:putative ABC transport system permease protein